MFVQGMVRITVQLVGPVADLIGYETIEYGLAQKTQLAGLITMMYAKYPRLAEESAALRVELNGQTVDMHTELVEGDNVAIILPVEAG